MINTFASFSGLKLNNHKTNALRLGSQKHEPDLPYNTVNELKILGIKFKNNTMAKHIEENWSDRIKKLQTLVKQWSNRDLRLHGKTVVVKTFLVGPKPIRLCTKINRTPTGNITKSKYNFI